MQKLKLLHYVIFIINLPLSLMCQSYSPNLHWSHALGQENNAQALQATAALREAAIIGNIELVQEVLAKGYDPTIADQCGMQPLHHAASNGHIEVLDLFLKHGICPDIADRYGLTALHYAIEGGHLEAIQLLLENKAHPNIADECGNMPLHLTVAQGQLSAVKALVAKKAAVNMPNGNHERPLYIAAENDYIEIVKFLLDNFADPSLPNGGDGDTPLHIAAKYNDTRTVNLLLERGLDVNISATESGNTALHLAVAEGHLEIIEVLLKNGADPTINNNEHNSPLHLGMHHDNIAILTILLDRIEALGLDKKPYVNSVNAEGITPLHLAAMHGNLHAIELLLANGAAIDTVDNYGYTPLAVAIQCNCSQVEIINLLLAKGAKVDKSEYMSLAKPLHQATKMRNIELLNSFLEKGANLSLQDIHGNSFLHIIAAKKDFDLLIQVLQMLDAHHAHLLTLLQEAKEDSIVKDILAIIVDYIYYIDWSLQNNQGESILTLLEHHNAGHREHVALVLETIRKRYKITNLNCP